MIIPIKAEESSFADYLYKQKEYELAILEYNRELFLTNNLQEKNQIYLQLSKSYNNINDFKSSLKFLNKLDVSILNKKDVYLYSLNLFDSFNSYSEAIKFYNKNCFNRKVVNSLKSYFYLRLFEYDSTKKYLVNSTISDSLTIVNELNKKLPYKKYSTSLFLSIIPGGGYLYTQRYGDALFGDLLIGTLSIIGYKYYSYGSKNRAYVAWSFAGGFYLSQMYGSLVSVKLYNKQININLVNRLITIFRRSF